jgi:hypothetical protein
MLFTKLGLTRKSFTACAALALLAGAAFLAATPAPAHAATMKCGSEAHYYSDATFTTQVGVRGWLPRNCNCTAYGSGSTSAFVKVLSSVC